jgi:hypothetical protein|tara:strand:+ start:497 stop:748 length:252 start_codon:yes stop_codon:yes gene_type:complete
MKNYKITNLKNNAVYYFNEAERSAFFLKNCYQDANYDFNYSIEELSDTPIQDKLNVRQFCWLDIVFTVCATSVVLLSIYQYAI